MKIVLNNDYGGFNLSPIALYMYLMAKGQTAYFYIDVSIYDDNYQKEYEYRLVSLKEIETVNHINVFCTPTYQGKILHNIIEDVIYSSDIDRTDPDLVSVVEVLGPFASGRYSNLIVEEIPDGTLYKLDTYDGMESLITQDDDDWLVARDQIQSTKQLIENLWATIKPREDDSIS